MLCSFSTETSFIDDGPLVQFMYLVSTHMPGGVTVADLGLLLCPFSEEHYELPLFAVLIFTFVFDTWGIQEKKNKNSDYNSNSSQSYFINLFVKDMLQKYWKKKKRKKEKKKKR